jgi:hypothetical protein
MEANLTSTATDETDYLKFKNDKDIKTIIKDGKLTVNVF